MTPDVRRNLNYAGEALFEGIGRLVHAIGYIALSISAGLLNRASVHKARAEADDPEEIPSEP